MIFINIVAKNKNEMNSSRFKKYAQCRRDNRQASRRIKNKK